MDQPLRESLSNEFIMLLQDSEQEVQCACISNVHAVMRHLNDNNRDRVFTSLSTLSTSPNVHTRAVLAQSIYKIVEVVGKSLTIDKILPICLAMLRDENNQVKLELVKEIVKLDKILGTDVINSKVTPALWEMSADKNWRVKLEIIKYLPTLGEALGSEFVDKLQKESLDWINDSV